VQISDFSTVTGILADIANLLGVPIAIIVLINDRRRARADREAQTYQSMQSEYSSFLHLCLAQPELRMHDYHAGADAPLSAELLARRMVALEILVSMFESAYFLYHPWANVGIQGAPMDRLERLHARLGRTT
jgi:hypothetical protein